MLIIKPKAIRYYIKSVDRVLKCHANEYNWHTFSYFSTFIIMIFFSDLYCKYKEDTLIIIFLNLLYSFMLCHERY